jgi:hypothetical protein
MLVLAALALSAAVPAEAEWRIFDRRARGVGETPTEYDAARVVRRGARVRAWIRYEILLSGLPDIRTRERVEIDCARHRSRTLETVRGPAPQMLESEEGLYSLHGPRPQSRRRHERLAPIAAGSVEDALARRLCAG